MVAEGGVLSLLPAYTSLLAACYKEVNNDTILHSIQDKTRQLPNWDGGNNRWQKEMFISDSEPDAMACGWCLVTVDWCSWATSWTCNSHSPRDANKKGGKPTTLCLTSAIKAVSQSQQTTAQVAGARRRLCGGPRVVCWCSWRFGNGKNLFCV
jgi:hypothetical protein